MGNGMRGFQCRHNSFLAAAIMESGQGFVIADAHIAGPAIVLEPSVFGAYTRIVQSGRNGVGFYDLTIFVLNDIRAVAMQHTHSTRVQRCRMTTSIQALASG